MKGLPEFPLHSESLGTTRIAWVDRPDKPTTDCLVWLDGELYTDRVHAPEAISNAQSEGLLPPLTQIYLPNVNGAGRHPNYTCNDRFAGFTAIEVPCWIEKEIGTFDRIYLCGLSLSGLQAIHTALKHPGAFAGVLAQSPSAWWEDERLASDLSPVDHDATRYWISVGTGETQENLSHPPTPLHQKTSQLDSVRRLADAMKQQGHHVHIHEFEGGHDPACWKDELPAALEWLLQDPRL